jgi:GPH family glycoside/pentoside/hexuronide:cation symporter
MPARTVTPTQTREDTATSPPLALPLLLGYGVGQIGGQIFRDTPAVLLPIFLSTMLGVPAWMAGLSILIPKMWVIFCDPLVGAWSDRRKATWGRRPFLLAGAIVSGLTFFALFVPPSFSSPFTTACYATFIFAVASTGFSIFSVPYLTIASEMTDDTHLRTKIMSYRLAFTAVGLIIGAGVAQPMVLWFGGGRAGYAAMGAVLGTICLVTMAASYFGTKGMRLTLEQPEPSGILRQFQAAWQNIPFRIVAAAYFLQMIGAACGYTVLGLFFIYVIRDIPLILFFILVLSVTAGLAQPLWLRVSRRLGKKPTYVLCLSAWCVFALSWLFVHAGTDTLVTLPVLGPLSSQGALVLVRALAIGVVNSGFILMAFSMLTDTIAYDREVSGLSREGSLSGVFSALEKLAFALGPAITGAFLSLMGFVGTHGGPGAQTPQAILGVSLGLSVLPVCFTAASIVPLLAYRLKKEAVLF